VIETRDIPASAFDTDALRAHFPALKSGAAFFDGPGGTQTPDVVGQAIYDTVTGPLSNRGTSTQAERNADQAVGDARAAVADLLGADPRTVIFGRSMTQLTFDIARTLSKSWNPGDEVVVSRLDHDANIRGWVAAADAAGATLRWADFDPETGELDPARVADVLSERTKIVAVTAASNLLGTMPDLARIAERVHDAGALFYVDGVHYTAHAPVDIGAFGADFYVCSPYKFLGPHCGVLTGRYELLDQLQPDKPLPAPNAVPEKYELGTLPYELMAGTTAAIDFLADSAPQGVPPGASRRERLQASMAAIEDYEDSLRARIEGVLMQLPGAHLYSVAQRRTPTLLVTFDGHDSAEISGSLAERRINSPAGSFYAYEPARRLGLGGSGGLRIGVAPYNDIDDVQRLTDALTEIVTG
jgi:cysteine desulfurase family protein (TIGR01976 family)